MEKPCKHCKDRPAMGHGHPWCSICWYNIPSHMREMFENGRAKEEQIGDYLSVHFTSVKEFRGGRHGGQEA